jgi:hypothetical protein
MKLLFRITVLALAAVGARTLFERIRPRVSGATGTGTIVGETLAPAFREAASNVKHASAEAVQDVVDATRQAADALQDAAAGTDPIAPAPEHQPLGTMASSDVGVEGGRA